MKTPRSLRPFFTLWGGQAVSLLGTQAVQFALIWWLTVQTGSATVLATATLFGLLPPVILGPLAGALVDRWNRKGVMLAADGLVAVASGVLAFAFAAGLARVELVFVILMIRGIGSAFHSPAMLASTSLMVPEEHLTRIQGLNQALQGGLLIIAAPLGAMLVALLPPAGIMMVDVVSALVAILPLLFIRVPQPEASGDGAERTAVWSDVKSGFSYLRQRRGLLYLVLLAAMVNLFLVPAFSLLPLLFLEELGGTAMQLAWAFSAFGIGSILGGILLGVWGGFQRRILTAMLALVALGAAVLVLGVMPAPLVGGAIAATLLVGFVVPSVNGPIQAVLQATVAADYQGRIFSLVGSLAGLTAPLGLLLAAPVADLAGVRAWYMAAAAACTLMGALALATPALMRIEEQPAAAERAA